MGPLCDSVSISSEATGCLGENLALVSNEKRNISHVILQKRALAGGSSIHSLFFPLPPALRCLFLGVTPNPTTIADSVMVKRPRPEDKASLYDCPALGERPPLSEPQCLVIQTASLACPEDRGIFCTELVVGAPGWLSPLSICLQPRSGSQGPGIKPHAGLPDQ